jgi:hypothetical protein
MPSVEGRLCAQKRHLSFESHLRKAVVRTRTRSSQAKQAQPLPRVRRPRDEQMLGAWADGRMLTPKPI